MIEGTIDKVIRGDCMDVMGHMPDSYVDTIITDPPYGLSFMGKGWDHGVPGVMYWAECLRVAKPGAILMAFGGTRTFHRLTCAIEDAGWQIRDCIQWIYGSGFPKSLCISFQFEQTLCERKEGPGGKVDWYYKTDGKKMRREVPFRHPQANEWAGWGTALKPSWEPIFVAMKPLEGTFAENAEKWGVAGLNIDGGRIPHANKADLEESVNKNQHEGYKNPHSNKDSYSGDYPSRTNYSGAQGRFPANIILDEEAGRMLDEQSGDRSSTRIGNPTNGKKGGMMFGNQSAHKAGESSDFRDSGGASRFFYTAKASRSERNAGCEGIDEKRSSDDYRPNDDGSKGVQSRLHGATKKGTNHHPTVKPLALMEYLCKLTKTPTGGIVLDPFAGSGTTGLAAYRTGRQYILIEKEAEYAEIARARITAERDKMALFETGDKRLTESKKSAER